MMQAQCGCGAVRLSLPGPSRLVVACHCTDCQRRSGAPFSVGAFYTREAVVVHGTPREYIRAAASGGSVRSAFCGECGSTVFWTASNLPGMVGVAVGAIADPEFPPPVRSVFERSRHRWVAIEADGVEHFPEGSVARRLG